MKNIEQYLMKRLQPFDGLIKAEHSLQGFGLDHDLMSVVNKKLHLTQLEKLQSPLPDAVHSVAPPQ